MTVKFKDIFYFSFYCYVFFLLLLFYHKIVPLRFGISLAGESWPDSDIKQMNNITTQVVHIEKTTMFGTC